MGGRIDSGGEGGKGGREVGRRSGGGGKKEWWLIGAAELATLNNEVWQRRAGRDYGAE